MRKVLKENNSEIVSNNYSYPKNKKSILAVLKTEHDSFCTYTDDYLTVSNAKDVEHFNPTLKPVKGVQDKNYENWFYVSHRWNNKKGDVRRWNKYNPTMRPTDNDLEVKIIYNKDTHTYISADPNDLDTQKFIDYLYLNDPELVYERSTYIQALYDNSLEENRGNTIKEYLKKGKNIPVVRFPRVIQTFFNFNPIEECLK